MNGNGKPAAVCRGPAWPAWLFAAALLVLGGIRSALGADGAPIRVTTTVGMVTDLVKQVGGPEVEVTGLMGAGVDPHLYKATASDLVKLQRAEVIFYSGLHLEGKMQGIFESLGKSGRPVRAVTDGLPRERLGKPDNFEGHFDPHVWFDVALWSGCAETVAATLAEFRPSGREGFLKRGSETRAKLQALDRWARSRAAEIPEKRRVLVTSHDAFNYFGRAYGFRVVALQGVSTVTEAGLADMTQLIDYIRSQMVPAFFVESSVPHATIERISRDAGVKIGGELFSDAFGTAGQMESGYDLGTYDGMIRHNVNLIAEALR